MNSCHYCVSRITPAHAGTTIFACSLLHPLQDHPRSRGDYYSVLWAISACLGSPPLTRGLLFSDTSFLPPMRITPAHAGTTLRTLRAFMSDRDHPRSRGDYYQHLPWRPLM